MNLPKKQSEVNNELIVSNNFASNVAKAHETQKASYNWYKKSSVRTSLTARSCYMYLVVIL